MWPRASLALALGGWELNSKNPSLEDDDDDFTVQEDYFVTEFF